MGLSGLALHTVQDELRKLSAAGLITNWSNGYHRFYRANPNHKLTSEEIRHRIMSKIERWTGAEFSHKHYTRVA